MPGISFANIRKICRLPLEPSSQRYITSFSMGDPFLRDNMEFAVITVKGQSFMLHQVNDLTVQHCNNLLRFCLTFRSGR